MYDNSDKSSPVQASYFVHGYSPWSPRGLVGGTGGAAAASVLLGVLALGLSVAGALPFIAWIAALVGIVCGLMMLLPRVTVAQKIMSWVGMAICIAAVVLLVG
ncbi:MAG: hypothetical protein QOF53_4120 [Nocardioidaceae bacterium]|jgi:hypothetical protein|nr:hypothetical protein [Nocardioidaceae bacterium]